MLQAFSIQRRPVLPKGRGRLSKSRGRLSKHTWLRQLIKQPSEGIFAVPDRMAMGYLVLMHAKHGGRAPAGDLRLVIARKGLCQLVIIHCRKHASNDFVRLGPIRNSYEDLQDCVDRYLEANIQRPVMQYTACTLKESRANHILC